MQLPEYLQAASKHKIYCQQSKYLLAQLSRLPEIKQNTWEKSQPKEEEVKE